MHINANHVPTCGTGEVRLANTAETGGMTPPKTAIFCQKNEKMGKI